jgi:hypothetical protein
MDYKKKYLKYKNKYLKLKTGGASAFADLNPFDNDGNKKTDMMSEDVYFKARMENENRRSDEQAKEMKERVEERERVMRVRKQIIEEKREEEQKQEEQKREIERKIEEKEMLKKKLDDLKKESEFTTSRFKIVLKDEDTIPRLLRHNSMDNINTKLDDINEEMSHNLNLIQANLNDCKFRNEYNQLQTLDAIKELRKQIKNKEKFMLTMCEYEQKYHRTD